MGFHTPPSRQPHPWMRRIQRSGPRPRRLSLSFLFVGSAASPTFLPFHHPPTPLWTPPKNAATPSRFLPRLHLPSLLLDTFEHAGRGRKGTKQQAAPGSPPPFLAPDRRRSGPTARGGRRSRPGRRCFQCTEAVSSFLQLAATISSGFRQLSNNVLLLYLRLLLSYLPG